MGLRSQVEKMSHKKIVYDFLIFCSSSSTNGIKEMPGFRQTFNISYSLSEHAINQTASCVSVDDVETSALLVSFATAC